MKLITNKFGISIFLSLIFPISIFAFNADYGILSTGYRFNDSFFAVYTFPLSNFIAQEKNCHKFSCSESIGSWGPQIGIFNLQKQDVFIGMGQTLFPSVLSIAYQGGIRINKKESPQLHVQFGMGSVLQWLIDIESDFSKRNQMHLGIELQYPIGG